MGCFAEAEDAYEHGRVSVPLRGVGCFSLILCYEDALYPVSVPLRGVGCFRTDPAADRTRRFRPLAGCGLFLIRRSIIGRIDRFPSPCGVWVVSSSGRPWPSRGQFPSPCGVWVVSTKSSRCTRSRRFPSPCGVWVVSFDSASLCRCNEFPSPCGVWVVSISIGRSYSE